MERRPITSFKRFPHIGLFHYPLLPICIRHSSPSTYKLPHKNPYVGYYRHSVLMPPYKSTLVHVSTQTDTVDSMVIGDKVIAAYGKNYKILLDSL